MAIRHAIALAAGLAVSALAQAASPIMVTEPGFDGFSIETLAFNGSSYDILSLTFDFSGTTTSDGGKVVIDGSPTSIGAPDGGTVTFFGSGSTFGFNFTSFNTFDVFKFRWDPDSTLSGAYGATGLDFIGGKVTAVTSGGTYSGVFGRVGTTPDVAANLTPVPEPGTMALLAAGLGVMGLVARRRRA